MVTIVTIDDHASYTGYASHGPQIFENSSGDLICVYGRDPVLSPEPISIKYSKDGGATWSTRHLLYTQDPPGTGIISDGTCPGGQCIVSRGGMISGVVKDDVLYLLITTSTNYSAFTKCDISDVANVADYSKWMSANDVSVPTRGKGQEGAGYDITSSPNNGYSSITLGDSDDILVANVITNPSKILEAVHWNGSQWKKSEILDLTEDIFGYPTVRLTKQGDWAVVIRVDATDTNDYIIAMRCNGNLDPTIAANWKSFDGLSNFDYVIDTGAGDFNNPRMEVDSAGLIHVIAPTKYAIGGHFRLFHNYWNGEEWVNGNTENAAGAQVNYNENPKVGDIGGGYSSVAMNVDAVGQLIVLISQQTGPSGAGVYSIFWQNEAWDFDRYTRVYTTISAVANTGRMRGASTVSLFAMTNSTPETLYCGIDGASQGCPWWEETVSPTIDELMKRLTTPYLNDIMCNNYKLLSIAAEQLDDIRCVSLQVKRSLDINQADNVSLDSMGELIACYRHTGESDESYRGRLQDYIHSLIGGGTVGQLEHTVKMAIPGITDDDFEIIDGYGTTGHGVGGHYAHIKVRIDIGFDWVIGNLWEMLDRARAACITIDELGPLVTETITLTESAVFAQGLTIYEMITLSEDIVYDVGKGIAETITLSEPRAGSPCHFCDITETDSLNYLCS